MPTVRLNRCMVFSTQVMFGKWIRVASRWHGEKVWQTLPLYWPIHVQLGIFVWIHLILIRTCKGWEQWVYISLSQSVVFLYSKSSPTYCCYSLSSTISCFHFLFEQRAQWSSISSICKLTLGWWLLMLAEPLFLATNDWLVVRLYI